MIQITTNAAGAPIFSDAPSVSRPITIARIVAEIEALPSLPEVASYLLRIDDDDVDLNHAITLMQYDQSLTAKALRFANSAYVSNRTALKTLAQAVQLMGLRTLRDMISIATIGSSFSTGRCPLFDLRRFWSHSISTACVASNLARHLNTAPGLAFTAGLLHDIGRMVLACSIPDEYTDVLLYQKEHSCSLVDAEMAVIELDHIQTGVALAQSWKLGDALIYAISYHHDASLAYDFPDRLPGIIYLANMISHAVDFSIEEDHIQITNEIFNAWNEIGLSGQDYSRLIDITKRDYIKATAIIHL